MGDDPGQSPVAAEMLRRAEAVAVTTPALCEFVWVLTRWYKLSTEKIAKAVEVLIETGNVQTDRPAVEAGLALCRAGGDFADGVIAFEGLRLGGAEFVSLDRTAVELIRQQGSQARLLDKLL
jgi:predicted nucleic-acid-binding protein